MQFVHLPRTMLLNYGTCKPLNMLCVREHLIAFFEARIHIFNLHWAPSCPFYSQDGDIDSELRVHLNVAVAYLQVNGLFYAVGLCWSLYHRLLQYRSHLVLNCETVLSLTIVWRRTFHWSLTLSEKKRCQIWSLALCLNISDNSKLTAFLEEVSSLDVVPFI